MLLKKITETTSVSTCEKFIRDVIIEEIKNNITSYRVDAMGNLIVYKKTSGNTDNPITVMLCAHMDEIGLVVTEITEDGMLKFDNYSLVNADAIVSKRVKCGDLQGIIGSSTHTFTDADKRIDINDLFIDIGADSKEEAQKYVMIGDSFAFVSDYVEFGDGYVKALALDNRAGCGIIIEALKEEYNCDIICLFTVQEETAMRGSKAAVFGVEADYVMNFDVCLANDITGVPSHMNCSDLGKGAVITVKGKTIVSDSKLLYLVDQEAKKYGLPVQIEKTADLSGDLNEIATANGGYKNITVAVPTRYVHSPVCTMSIKDYNASKELVKVFLHNIDSVCVKGMSEND